MAAMVRFAWPSLPEEGPMHFHAAGPGRGNPANCPPNMNAGRPVCRLALSSADHRSGLSALPPYAPSSAVSA